MPGLNNMPKVVYKKTTEHKIKIGKSLMGNSNGFKKGNEMH